MRDSGGTCTGRFRYERVEDAGHWMQLDRPSRDGLLLEHLDAGGQCLSMTRSIRPYSAAWSALKKRSRSMSVWTRSSVCPVCLA